MRLVAEVRIYSTFEERKGGVLLLLDKHAIVVQSRNRAKAAPVT
jgi:hypothetical protein